MKKILVVAIALSMLLSFAACNLKDNDSATNTSESQNTGSLNSSMSDTNAPNAGMHDTSVADTSVSDTRVPDVMVEPDNGENIYLGCFMGQEIRVTLLEDVGEFVMSNKQEFYDEVVEKHGLNGTLWIESSIRAEFSDMFLVDGFLTFSSSTMYWSETLKGTEKEAYAEIRKKQYESGEILKEEYDKYLWFINGEEIIYTTFTEMTLKIKLNEADKTCFIVRKEDALDGGLRQIQECEYTADGKLTKEYTVTSYDNYGWLHTYYPDGETVKTIQKFKVIVDEETGGYVFDQELFITDEFYENGKKKTEIAYTLDDSVMSVTEYNDNGIKIKKTDYDENGDAYRYFDYFYGEDTCVTKKYEGKKLVLETHEKLVHVPEYDNAVWRKVKTIDYNYDGTKLVIEYDEKGNMVKETVYNPNDKIGGTTLYSYIDDVRISKVYIGDELVYEIYEEIEYITEFGYIKWKKIKTIEYRNGEIVSES